MTTDRDPTSDPADVDQLRREIVRLERVVRDAEARHRAEVERITSSARYRTGSTLMSLGTIAGWRRLPAEVAALRALASRRRNRRALTPERDATSRSGIETDCVLDEFSQRAFEPELRLRPVGRRRRPRRSAPAMFFAESAWVGNGGRWRHQFSHFTSGNDLDRLIDRYRALGVPTVFWNKEDPAHFDTFIGVAARFDQVFTTDADCIERYRALLGHDRIHVLPFAAQPAAHNPIGRDPDARSICFAGAWRGDVHPQRVEQLETLLDAGIAAGDLRIFARRPSDGRADFPARYAQRLVGEIPYDEMVTEYKRHACFLNVNTVTSSPTMLSRRVFEILACRTPVVSAPSPAIERYFDGIVPTPGNLEAASAVLAELVDDPTRRDRLGQLGYRTVMSSHTYQHRVAAICEAVGIDGFPAPALPALDAVLEVATNDDVARALATARPLRDSVRDVVVICHDGADEGPEIESRDRVHLVRVGPNHPPVATLALLPGGGELVAFLDAGARYGAAMLSDTVLATRFADADVYGKSSSHAGDGDHVRTIGDGHEFRDTSDVISGTAVVRRSILDRAARMPVTGPGSISRAAVAASSRRFAVDRFNHVAAPEPGRVTGVVPHRITDVLF